jgi:hypothetical protein
MSQITHTLVMVAPTDFAFNEETAANNEFQNRPDAPLDALRITVRAEFDEAVRRLRAVGVQVLVLEKPDGLPTMPDAVFPNNWFATEPDGTAYIFKMASQNRQAETRQWPALHALLSANGHAPTALVRLDDAAAPVLEGTGSLILDRVEKIAYASLSERTTEEALAAWAAQAGYREVVAFNTRSSTGLPIYHTNVMMSICQGFAVVCLDCIPDAAERERVLTKLAARHEVIELTLEQTETAFCANILQVQGTDGPVTVMSQSAFEGFSPAQRARIEAYGLMLPVPIPTIERVGGGSARCMMAEVF